MTEIRPSKIIIQELYATGLTLDQQVLITELVMTLSRASEGGEDTGAPTPSAARARRYRAKKRDESVTSVTKRDESVTRHAKEKVAPKENTIPNYPSDSLPLAKRGTRLPIDWQPDEVLLSKAKGTLDLSDSEISFETEAFRDYFRSQCGAKGTKLDWSATWMNWMREAHRRKQRFAPKKFVSKSGTTSAGYSRAHKPMEPEPEFTPPTPEEIERRNALVAQLKKATKKLTRTW